MLNAVLVSRYSQVPALVILIPIHSTARNPFFLFKSSFITKHQPDGNVKGFLLEKDSVQVATVGNFNITVHHEFKMGWSPGAKESIWPLAGGLIIAVAPDEFYVAGTGLVMTFTPTIKDKKAGFITIDDEDLKRKNGFRAVE